MKLLELALKPGPQDYSPDHSKSLKRFPAYSMSKSMKNLASLQVKPRLISPGPSSYSNEYVVKNNPHATIPQGIRDIARVQKPEPGPADYSVCSTKASGP